jgi:hypothetical protein
MKDIYGENLAEKVGTVHDYLGMEFDYSFDDKVRINMNQYISKVINEEMMGVYATPAADYSYKIQGKDRKILSKELVDAIHHKVFQL